MEQKAIIVTGSPATAGFGATDSESEILLPVSSGARLDCGWLSDWSTPQNGVTQLPSCGQEPTREAMSATTEPSALTVRMSHVP